MEEIKIGEYIRLDNGEIGKVIDIKENPKRVVYSEYGEIALCSSITKYSKELIDLVKPGDFVNGYIVTDKYLFAGKKPVLETEGNDTNCNCLCEKDIKTILTKEQFEANCYKVGGEDEGCI